MKPHRHLRRPAHFPRFAQPAMAACVLAWALVVPCGQAAANVVGPSTSRAARGMPMADAGALNMTPASPDAPEASGTPGTAADGAAKAAAKPAASVFEDVLREQDPAQVPLSLALMGGALGILYVRRRKR
jgi:hypothetical protein